MLIDYIVHVPLFAHTPIGTVILNQNTVHLADIAPVSLEGLTINVPHVLRHKHGVTVIMTFTGLLDTSYVQVTQPSREPVTVMFKPLKLSATQFDGN